MPARALRACALGALAVSLVRCAPGAGELGEAEAEHTARSPIHGNAPYFWAETDYVTFKQIAQAAPFRTGQPLGSEHPITRRLQAWADAMDAEVRKDVRRKTRAELVAPRPIIVVVPAKEANAWVSGVPACVSGEADLSAIGEPGRAARGAALAFISHDRVKQAFSMFGAPPPECATPTNWGSREEAIAFFNATGAKCRLEADGERVKVVGEGCTIEGTTAPTSATQLTYYATSPYIHFTTAMIAMAKDERGIVGTVAHELAHYYRAHAVSDLVMDEYDHWYEQRDPPARTAPPPAPDSAELEERFRRVMPVPMARVPGQRLSYRITNAVAEELGRVLREARAPGFACAHAAELLEGGWAQEFSPFSGGFVPRETQERYLAYEAALLACAPEVRVAEAPGAGELALEAVRDAFRRGASRFADPPVEAGTLAELLSVLHERAAPLDAEADAFFAELEGRRIGHYTAEQEADELSLEYFARVGLAPRGRIDTNFELVAARAAEDPARFVARNGGLDLGTCEAMLRADFREPDPSGGTRAVFVPLGSLHDPHHGDCYRLFNMSQELRAHRFRASGASPSFEGEWEAVRQAAQEATDAFRPSGPGGFGGPQHLPQGGAVLPPGGTIVDGF